MINVEHTGWIDTFEPFYANLDHSIGGDDVLHGVVNQGDFVDPSDELRIDSLSRSGPGSSPFGLRRSTHRIEQRGG